MNFIQFKIDTGKLRGQVAKDMQSINEGLLTPGLCQVTLKHVFFRVSITCVLAGSTAVGETISNPLQHESEAHEEAESQHERKTHTRHLSLDPAQLKRVADAAAAVLSTSDYAAAQRNSQQSLAGSQQSASSLTSPVLRRWSQVGGSSGSEQLLAATPSTSQEVAPLSVRDSDSKAQMASRRKSGWAVLRSKFATLMRRAGQTSAPSVPEEPHAPASHLQLSDSSHRQASIVSSDSQWSFKSALSEQDSLYDVSDEYADAVTGSVEHVVTYPMDLNREAPAALVDRVATAPAPDLSASIPQTYVTQPSNDPVITGAADVTVTQDDVADVPSANDLVDLHSQLNQPITRSPVLMSCYKAHMTKLQCAHWAAHPPRRRGFSEEVKTDYADPVLHASWIPHFAYMKEGFTPALMVDKHAHDDLPEPPNVPPPQTADARRTRFFSDPRASANIGERVLCGNW